MAQYSLFVLKVPLNTNEATNHGPQRFFCGLDLTWSDRWYILPVK